jgi:hypothetical protein
MLNGTTTLHHLVAILSLTAITGCSSHATFENVPAEVVCQRLRHDLEPGQTVVDDGMSLAILHRTTYKVADAGDGRVRAEVTVEEKPWPLSSLWLWERRHGQERLILARLAEALQRLDDAQFVDSNVSGLDNVKPLEVQIATNTATTTLAGTTTEQFFRIVQEDIWHLGRVWGYIGTADPLGSDTLIVTLQPAHTHGPPNYADVRLTAVAEGPDLRITVANVDPAVVSWRTSMHGPRFLASLLRRLGADAMTKLPTMTSAK